MASGRRYRLVALHGFLGRPSDWDEIRAHLPDAEFATPDLWSLFAQLECADRERTLGALSREIDASSRRSPTLPTFVLAYSFGARLALGLLATDRMPSAVDGVCLVSCHPGLCEDDRSIREARHASDEQWARQILEAPEHVLWRAWDGQAVFAGSTARSRPAGLPASRSVLARALRELSLASQPDYRPHLRRASKPLLWVTGADDAKFSALAHQLAGSGVPATFASIDGAGHRVPWDAPARFSRLVRHWIVTVPTRIVSEATPPHGENQ